MLYSCFDSGEETKDLDKSIDVPFDFLINYEEKLSLYSDGFVETKITGSNEIKIATEYFDFYRNSLSQSELVFPYSLFTFKKSLSNGFTIYSFSEKTLDGDWNSSSVKINNYGEIVWEEKEQNIKQRGVLVTGLNNQYVVRNFGSEFIIYNHENLDTISKRIAKANSDEVVPFAFINNEILYTLRDTINGNYTLTKMNENNDIVWSVSIPDEYLWSQNKLINGNKLIVMGVTENNTKSTYRVLELESGSFEYLHYLNSNGFSIYSEFIDFVDGEFAIIGSNNDVTKSKQGACIVKYFNNEGEFLNEATLGNKSIYQDITGAVSLGNGQYLITGKVKNDSANCSVIFKSDLNNICYLDSIDFKNYSFNRKSSDKYINQGITQRLSNLPICFEGKF